MSAKARFEPIDQVYAALRGAAILLGVAFAYVGPGITQRDDVLIAFGFFAAYGCLLYTLGWSYLRRHDAKDRFYAVVGAADLAFVLYLMLLTGGEQSPFYRALYLWVAMPAIYYGMRVGTLASATAFIVYAWLFDPAHGDGWNFTITALGLLLHGPVIGYLIGRERARARELHALRAQLAEQVPKSGP